MERLAEMQQAHSPWWKVAWMRPGRWHGGQVTHRSLLCWLGRLSRDGLLFHNSSSRGFLDLGFPRWSFFSFSLLFYWFLSRQWKNCWGAHDSGEGGGEWELCLAQFCFRLNLAGLCQGEDGGVLGLTASKGHFHPQYSICKLSQAYIPPSQGKKASASWVTERGDRSRGKALGLLRNVPETDGKARSWNWHSCVPNPGLQIWVFKIVPHSLVLSVLRQYSPFSSEGKKQLAETQTGFFMHKGNHWLLEFWQCENHPRFLIKMHSLLSSQSPTRHPFINPLLGFPPF